MEAAESQSDDSKERPKASRPEKELPVDRINTTDGDIHTMVSSIMNLYLLHLLFKITLYLLEGTLEILYFVPAEWKVM